MRKFNKYKLFSKLKLNFFYKKILCFKKSKWKLIQSFIKKIPFKANLINQKYKISKFKTWSRVKLTYKENLLFKNEIQCRFDEKIIFSKNILYYLIYHEFFLDKFLFNIKLFTSLYAARNVILSGGLLINGKICLNNKYVLKKGDIVYINTNFNLNVFNNRISKELRCSFMQVDFYTKTIVLLKNWNTLNFFDLILFLHQINKE